MRGDILTRIHDGHFGITKCRERALQSVWWPGISSDIAKMVQNCQFCEARQPTQGKEPLLTTPLPDRPFQQVAADICEVKDNSYLVLVDYYSRYLEISHLPRTTTSIVINKMKNIFAHHGVPETLVTDNGRQFTAAEFQEFAKSWGFHHTTSSPYFPQANGEAERAVKEAKKILAQKDPFLALLAHRSSPTTATGASPAELLMGRRIRNSLPTLPQNLEPRTTDKQSIIKHDSKKKEANKLNYNRRHGARSLPDLQPGDVVLQKLDHEKVWAKPATVHSKVASRSYMVETPSGMFRRNRRHLKPTWCFKPPSAPTSIHLPSQTMASPKPTHIHSPVASTRATTLGLPKSPADQHQLSLDQPSKTADQVQPTPAAGLPQPAAGLPQPAAGLPQPAPGAPSQKSTPRVTRSGRIVQTPARYKD